MLKYPIGYSDFRDIIQEERVLVDKTLMIPQVMDDAKVLLFTRPRRFRARKLQWRVVSNRSPRKRFVHPAF